LKKPYHAAQQHWHVRPVAGLTAEGEQTGVELEGSRATEAPKACTPTPTTEDPSIQAQMGESQGGIGGEDIPGAHFSEATRQLAALIQSEKTDFVSRCRLKKTFILLRFLQR
jgi:hypothetical protein